MPFDKSFANGILDDLGGDGMKDHSVGPTKLLNVARCGKLLVSLGQRIAVTGQQRVELAATHAKAAIEQEQSLDEHRTQVIARCRQARKDLLRQWDQAEEDLTAQYERRAVAGRTELNRMALVYRTKKNEERKTIERKFRSREHAVLAQFENRKNQPGQQSRKEFKQIEEALEPIKRQVQWARELTIGRLDGLPDWVESEDDPGQDHEAFPAPESVKDSVQQIARLTRKCDEVIDEMREGTGSKIVDTYYLPAAVVLMIAIWAGVAMTVVQQNRVVWAVAGILPAAILGFAVYLFFLWPLKRLTRQLYPRVERIARDADRIAESGRAMSRRIASEAIKELSDRRDAHLASALQWKEEQFKEMEQRFASEEIESRKHLIEVLNFADKDYSRRIKLVNDEFKQQAETLAQQITQSIAGEDQSRDRIMREAAAERLGEHQVLLDRLRQGVQLGFGKMLSSWDRVEADFPPWSTWANSEQESRASIDYLPIGAFQVGQYLRGLMAAKSWAGEESDGENGLENGDENRDAEQSPSQSHQHSSQAVSSIPELSSGLQIPEQVPLVLHRRLHSALVIQSDDTSMEKAVEIAQQLLWRLLTGLPPSRSKLTLIDPLGGGRHFTSLMALSDHDPRMIGHRVWTTGDEIESRLAELAHHAENVLQTSLRDRFARIEDYNEAAGDMAVPYCGIAAVGFPTGLSREANKHLQSIIDSGLRCGVFTILVCNFDQTWPSDMPVPSGENVMTLRVSQTDGWQVESGGVRKLGFVPFPPPPPSIREMLAQKIGRLAKGASRA